MIHPTPVTAKVSILLPAWNAAGTLESALRSLERQTWKDWECVLVDDGSSDDSLQLARSFADRDSRFRLLERAHEGIVPSLNAGLAACRGEFIARMDADDWSHRERLAQQVEALEAAPHLVAVGCFVRIFPRKQLRDGRRAYEEWLNQLRTPEQIWRERFIECPIAHPTLMIRRDALLASGYRDRGWPEDYDLILRLLRAGPVIGTVPHKRLGWRDHEERTSRVDPNFSIPKFNACRAWHLHRDFLKDRPEYILWGHGQTGRALRKALSDLGHQPTQIVEVHPRRVGNVIGGARVVSFEELPPASPYPIVVSVAGSRPRGEIRAFLENLGYREGFEFVCTA